MSAEPAVPETRVLAVASHVVSGNVGNKIAVFAMQSLGCDVAALNTVQFSTVFPFLAQPQPGLTERTPPGNHTGYKQWKGTRVSAQEISHLWEGLKMSYLDDFDMMLSGYVPGAPALEAVGRIAEELRARARDRPGSFFWVLDPVMGDNGNLYVGPDVVPAYKKLLVHADLILPNQFEAELLSGVRIDSMATLHRAIDAIHETYRVPHVVITSVNLAHDDHPPQSLSVVGSSMTSAGKSRAFKIVFPAIDCYFSGTGDMFAALMVARMREAVWAAASNGEGAALRQRHSWLSSDEVGALDLPLAKAAEKVLASMHEVLEKTAEAMGREMKAVRAAAAAEKGGDNPEDEAKKMHLLQSRAAELRLVRNLESLRSPKVEFRARKM